MTTIALSNIPDLSASVSVSRIAAVGYPLERTLGFPGDRLGQRTVLQDALKAAVVIDQRGGIHHLPYSWPESPKQAMARRISPPPITIYLKKHPWEFPRFLARNVPDEFVVDLDG